MSQPRDALIDSGNRPAAFGTYVVEGLLGRGAMGTVYRARHRVLGRPVAIKRLHTALVSDTSLVRRLMQEATLVNTINHPHIVEVYDFVEAPDLVYTVMELLEGETLAARLARQPVPFASALRIATRLGQALVAAHSVSVVHRDVKPDNVFLCARADADWVKVLDFGIAKRLAGAGPRVVETQMGDVLGTPRYMAPEQAAGLDVDARTDIYAFGTLLFELLTGAPPFDAAVYGQLAADIITQPPPRLPPTTRLAEPIPDELRRLVMACLSKAPEERPQTMREVVAQLEALPTRDAAPPTARGLEALLSPNLLAHVAALPRHVVSTEKRLLTVAYAELSGQASLTEVMGAPAAKAQTVALAEAFAEVVRQREGQLERLPGAGFLVVFGLLQAHEDDPRRAVEACLDFVRIVDQANRRLPRPLQLRSGLHGATVTSAFDESSLSDSLGVAELAAVARRLLSTVPTGLVIASKALEALVRGAVQAVARDVVVGGQKQEPVFEVLGLAEREPQGRPLVGRQVELGLLGKLVEAVRARKAAGAVLVGGPGLGKSRLLAEGAALARRAGAQVLTARGARSASPAPFDVARQLVQSLFDAGAAGKSPLAGLGPLGVAPHDVARVERLFGLERAGDAPSARDDDAARDRAALLLAFDAASARRPLLLAIDDLHLVDRESLELLEELQRRASRHPFGLLAAARPGDLSGLAPRLRRIDVGPLDLATTSALVSGLLDGEPSPALLDFVGLRAEGNPFFIEALVNSLVELGVARREGHQWVLGDPARAALPDALGLVVAARLSRLSAQARALLRVGAVIGRAFSLALAGEASPDRLDLAAAADECVQRGALSRGDGDELRFEQSLTHEALLQRLTPVDLAYLHGRIGEALERRPAAEQPLEALARHWLEAGQPRKATRALRQAGDRALERGAFAAAADAFTQCLGLMQREASQAGSLTEPAAVALLDVAGRAMGALVHQAPERALALFDGLTSAIPPSMGGLARVEVLRQRGLSLQRLSRLPEATTCLREAQARLPAQGHETLSASLKVDLSGVLEARGELAAATALLLDGLPLVSSPRLKDPNLPWQYLNALGRVHLRAGKGPAAEEFFEAARQRARQAGSGAGEAKAVTNLGVARAQRGDSAAALTLLSEAMALAEQAGDRVGVLRVRFNRARVVMASNPAAAQADLDAVLEQARDLGWREGEAMAARAMDELKGARPPPPR
ncbi:MAG: protein kinase [Myxococcaceae bacterium]|jgi:serine/threonine protein kinase/tetratricopeptide (TPR) repeat protein|nr:protein kinase [Myxococcaceae bacterium]MCA3013565.1 protein kinase [Myxococcaceae bacterium]